MLHVAFCDYFATGEGRTVIVAVGTSSREVGTLFEENAPPYFEAAVQKFELAPSALNGHPVAQWLPVGALDRAAAGGFHFFGMFQQNLS